jgi:hypothetical protein
MMMMNGDDDDDANTLRRYLVLIDRGTEEHFIDKATLVPSLATLLAKFRFLFAAAGCNPVSLDLEPGPTSTAPVHHQLQLGLIAYLPYYLHTTYMGSQTWYDAHGGPGGNFATAAA